MNDTIRLEKNNQYLAASLQWLLLRLQRLLPDSPTPVAKEESFLSKKASSKAADKFLVLDQEIQEAADLRKQRATLDTQPALLALGELFGLSDYELEIVLLCAAIELDPTISDLLAQVPINQGRSHPTFALAMTLFDSPTWDAMAATRSLRYLRLLEINQPGATPLTISALRLDERIVNYIKGMNWIDERLLNYGAMMTGKPLLSGSQLVSARTVLTQIHGSSACAVVQLLGTDPDSNLALAQTVCRGLNRKLFRIAASEFPSHVAELESFARLWQRESILLHLGLYIDASQLDSASAEAVTLQRFLQKQAGLVFVGLSDAPLRWDGHSYIAEIAKPSASEQYDSWLTLLKPLMNLELAVDNARRLAGQFNLNLNEMRSAAQQVVNSATNDPKIDAGKLSDRLWDACGNLTRPRLDALAQRLETKATWDNLVVPDEAGRLLRQIAGQVQARHQVYDEWGFNLKMNRGFGISALFAGDSGTGKTMAAEVIANDLRLDLYRIDLSAVVSKYIGQTEKNLRKLFDAAEQGGAILFFDEADALFGKRSEVKDSHDRYANIEINYLLQRMESFGGLAILATNMKSALDPAFMRRLRFIVDFQFPNVSERKIIWQNAFPQADPVSGFKGVPVEAALDYGRLAHFNLSGGNIHSITLNAAFLAAQSSEQRISMAHILDATRSELRKLNKPVNEAEFRQMAVVATNFATPIENRVRVGATIDPTTFNQTTNVLESSANSFAAEEERLNAAATLTKGAP